jgi:SAM-dependent methyltransferase
MIRPQEVVKVDDDKLGAFVQKAVVEFGVTLSAALTVIGDKLGLYKALWAAGPLTAEELARQTGTVETYIRPWLVNQAAAGNLTFDAKSGRYELPAEHALALADDTSPHFVLGGYQIVTAMIKAEPRIREAFKTGDGMLWGEHDHNLFEGTERFFRPGYAANLVSSWIPALTGVKEKLENGARVADVGCGHGASTVIMAEAFPKSLFWGFDNHAPSIVRAREAATDAQVADRVSFEVAAATTYSGGPYDLIAFFDCLHDMGDPTGALRRAAEKLAKDGSVLIVEPMAGEREEENFNPVGRVFAGASALCCTPNAVASGNTVLGTIAGEAQFQAVAREAGFTRFRRATETPFNRIFEARL